MLPDATVVSFSVAVTYAVPLERPLIVNSPVEAPAGTVADAGTPMTEVLLAASDTDTSVSAGP